MRKSISARIHKELFDDILKTKQDMCLDEFTEASREYARAAKRLRDNLNLKRRNISF